MSIQRKQWPPVNIYGWCFRGYKSKYKYDMAVIYIFMPWEKDIEVQTFQTK